MSSNHQTPVNNAGLVLILSGVVIYILVDSGFIQWPRQLSRVQDKTKQQVINSEDQLLNYAERLGLELQNLEKETNAERDKLKKLQDEVKQYEKNIQQKKLSLSELDSEIRQLSSLKAAISDARAKVIRNETKGKQAIRTLASQDGFTIWRRPPNSLQNLVENVSRISQVEAYVEPASIGSSQYKRIVTALTFDPDQRIFLTPKGVLQVRALSEGAIQLGYKQMTLAHDGAEESLEKLQVVKSYLDKVYGDHIKVTSSRIKDASLQLENGLEIWLKEAR